MLANAHIASPAKELDPFTLKRAQRGERAALHALVQTYERRVFALLSRMLYRRGRAQAIEDLAQETFLRAFRALPRFQVDGRACLSTWLLTIATRLALDELSARTTDPLGEVELPASGPSPEQASSDRRLGLAIAKAVAALAPDHRAVFVLREYHDLSYDDIARALDVETGTVKSRLNRARLELRTQLEEHMPKVNP